MSYSKSVYSINLDGTVPSDDSDTVLLYLLTPSIISEELCVWWNLCLFSCILLIVFVSGCYITYYLFHALYIIWRSVQRSLTRVLTSKNDTRLCLLLQLRVAIGIKRIERMAYCELTELHNSHSPLLYLEGSRQLSRTNKLCRTMKDASLSELPHVKTASDIISRHVDQVLSQNLKYVKQQRKWERILCKFNQRCFDDLTIERFQLLLLVLSLFESTDKDIKTVILYGVPGLPSISLSVTATYAEIRAMIAQRAPNLTNLYFVAGGRIIQIEDTVIDWGSGHLVLNVHTARDLPGGSERHSSENERKDRNRNTSCDLQRLLLSDVSGDEDFDDSTSSGVSDSGSFQDSDSSWNIEKNQQRGRKRRNTKKGKNTLRTASDKSVLGNCDDTMSMGAERTPPDAYGDEGLDDSVFLGICDSGSFQDSDMPSDSDKELHCDVSVQKNRDERNIKGAERTPPADASADEGLDESISLEISDTDSFLDSDSSWDLEKNKKRNRKRCNERRRKGATRTTREVSLKSKRNAARNKGAARSKREVSLQNTRNAARNKGAARSKREVSLQSKRDSKKQRARKLIPVEYDRYSQEPPTAAQCQDCGRDVWNAVGAFYASQPPPPERSIPYFESLFCRPFLVQLMCAAIGKLIPTYSEQETDFDYVHNMLHTVSLFNEYSKLHDVVGDFDVDNPVPLETLRLHVQHLEAKTIASEIIDLVRDLLLLLDEYRRTFNSALPNPTKLRQDLVTKMNASIDKVNLAGTVGADKFYTMYDDYQGLKDRCCKICTVCGVRRPAEKLRDAVSYFNLLKTTDDMADIYNALVDEDLPDDTIGKLAQRCYHIEDIDGQLYHFLDFDEELYEQYDKDYDGKDPTQDSRFSLLTSGEIKKLPACDDCFHTLKQRHSFLEENGGDDDSDKCPPLPKFCFKERDFGRIPVDLPVLGRVARTAISPFVAFTRILQLRNPVKDAGCGQQATSGTNFSIGTDTIKGKEFFIAVNDNEFCQSYKTSLPRDDVASRLRLFFMGNEDQWKNTERKLNKMNIGLDFDADDCLQWIDLLKRTEVFGGDIVAKRADELENLLSTLRDKLQRTTTTHSVDGVVLEESEIAYKMAEMSSDDVARARGMVDDKGVHTNVPGITSSLFCNHSMFEGKLPALQAMLRKMNPHQSVKADRLLLGLEKVLPNEFLNFPSITALTFPDKFPIPVTSHTFMGTSMMKASVRQHLLDFYDGRFGSPDLLFWWYSVLSRHTTIRNTASYFKKNTDAKKRFEDLCNDEDLEDRVRAAMRDDSSDDAKTLNAEFTSLINVIGGKTPWSSAERQKTLGRLYAISNFMGPPSVFFTIAPCIADSEICMKLLNLPTFRYKLRESTHAERSTWSARNPMASAKAYHTIIKALVSTFINIPTGNIKYSTPIDCLQTDGQDEENVSFSAAFEKHLNSRMGCIGAPTAFYGIHEAQGRGALHMHALVWTLLNNELLEKCTVTELQRICVLIDQRIATCISDDGVKIEKDSKKDGTFQRCARRVIPMGLASKELVQLGKRVMYSVQSHYKCTFTCFKNKSYWASCRLAMPRIKSLVTKFWQLIPSRNDKGELEIPLRSDEIPAPPDNDVLPLKTRGVLWVDHKRHTDVDANLVEGNPLISASFGWNTCVSFMATPGSCQSALFYVANYMRKPIDLLSGILPIVYSSLQKKKKYPSRATDAGEPSREAKYLSSIILNKLNASQEVSDQIAASAVYGYDSFVSSHGFANLFVVDFFQYLKRQGRALGDDAVLLDEDDKLEEVDIGEMSDTEETIAPEFTSGIGQTCVPMKRKLSEDEGGRILIDMVRDIDDYIHRGPELADLSPFTYRAVISRVRKGETNRRSSKVVKPGKRAHTTFPFSNGHPLADTHVQRLRGKFSIIQFIGMHMPANPGPKPDDPTKLDAWERKMTKVCNFIEAVYLPIKFPERGFRPYQDVLAELALFKYGCNDDTLPRTDTFINKHILRTIGFALNNKSVTSQTKKMLQLVRHQFSRKRGVSVGTSSDGSSRGDGSVQRELLEVVRDVQLDEICGKNISPYDKYLDDVKTRYNSLMGTVDEKSDELPPCDSAPYCFRDAEVLLSAIKIDNAERESETSAQSVVNNCQSGMHSSKPMFDRASFLKNLNKGQTEAAEYMMQKLDKDLDNEQLLMLLHGSPGTGKTFLIERLRDTTDIKMRITATSGIAAMSLKGSTIDRFLGLGRSQKSKKKKSKTQIVSDHLGDATLLVLDECSMLGCRKLIDLDTTLQKVKNNSAPFGGLDVILVGDFAQLPPVKQEPILDAMVNSTSVYTDPPELSLSTTALMQRFRKFDLVEFNRSKSCGLLSSLLTRFRDFSLKGGSLKHDDIKQIGFLTDKTLQEDPEFVEAPFLVATRKEKDAITETAGILWAKRHNVPVYYWYKRPTSFKGSAEDADRTAISMSSRCCGVKGYYIEGAPCLLKRNIAPLSGYANGTKGNMTGIFYQDDIALPRGRPGELIKIEPPQYICMQVSDDNGITTVPCKRMSDDIEYYYKSEQRHYYCLSCGVNLAFARTVHEVQGQTLDRAVLLLGRNVGRSVGRVSWSLLYVALSRVKKLEHLRFFPHGRRGSVECFKYLTKLTPPEKVRKWTQAYKSGWWDGSILQANQLQKSLVIEAKLSQLGRAETLSLKNDILKGYLSGLGRAKLYKLVRKPLQHMLNKHMVDKGGWEPTDDVKEIERPTKRRRLRQPRNSSSRIRKNQQGIVNNQNSVGFPKVKNIRQKPAVQASGKSKTSTAPVVSRPSRRSKRLRENASAKVMNLPHKPAVQALGKRKTRTELLVSRPPRRSKRLRVKASGYILNGVSRQNEASRCVPKMKRKKKNYSVGRISYDQELIKAPPPTIAQLIAADEDEIKSHYYEEVQDNPKFHIFEIANDGNSLFGAFAHQLYGLEDKHPFIRNICCRYIEMYRERFKLINAAERNNVDFSNYLDSMRTLHTSGGNLEITALSEFYQRPVEIYARHNVPWTTISHSAGHEKGLPPIRITVDNGNHYCSVVSEHHKKNVLLILGVFEEPVMFQHAMKVQHGYKICKVKDDGNCIFSAVSHQIYGVAGFHALIRDKCCDYMGFYRERFQEFIDTEKSYVNFSHYLNNMRTLRTWGGNLEITALSELYQRPVEVYAQQTTPRITFSDSVNYDNDLPPIRVSFKNGNHYDSIVSESHGSTVLNIDEAGEFEDAVLASLT